MIPYSQSWGLSILFVQFIHTCFLRGSGKGWPGVPWTEDELCYEAVQRVREGSAAARSAVHGAGPPSPHLALVARLQEVFGPGTPAGN
jgi:hypothetical protein